ncbi:MAG TPA: alcohol dehydrogenase catalytic domain-containing protein [Bryobacteraceae bacterium]|nr:alcohol dehydrogenase catalytic domain-containing protein [Bryobacteraceae bacterium]
MRIAELYAARQFRITEGPSPDPGPGQVQVRVRSVGICGSDLHYYEDGGVGELIPRLPIVLGHEPTGEVHKIGTGVTGLSVGDRAMLEPAVYCYHCEFCRSGRHNCCENIVFFSTPPEPGFFREFVNMPAHNLVPLPKELDWNVGTLFEPLAVVLHSLVLAPIQYRDTVAIIGTGPIGLMTIAAVKASGAGRVWAVEPSRERRELASLMGADVVLDPTQVDPVKQILSDTGKRGVDIAFDCATKTGTVNQSIKVVRSAGRVVIVGIPTGVTTPVDLHELRRKEAVFYNVRRSNHETETAVAMLREHSKKFAPIVTHAMPLDNIQRAFDMLEHKKDGSAKIVLTV